MPKRRDVIVVILGLTVGIGATLLIDRYRAPATEPIRRLAAEAVAATTTPTTAAPDTSTAPESAVAAIEGFLAAEQEGTLTESFTFLSREDRQTLGSVAGWEAAHADLLPPVETFSIRSGEKTGGSSQVVTDVAFTPSLDEVSGLVPGDAIVTWHLVRESGGWRIALFETVVEPRYAPEIAATESARRWVIDRTACIMAEEYEGGLLGNPGLADSLCGAAGPVEVGTAGTARGPDRRCPVRRGVRSGVRSMGPRGDSRVPVPLQVVLAPVGVDWIVIGVLPGGEAG